MGNPVSEEDRHNSALPLTYSGGASRRLMLVPGSQWRKLVGKSSQTFRRPCSVIRITREGDLCHSAASKSLLYSLSASASRQAKKQEG